MSAADLRADLAERDVLRMERGSAVLDQRLERLPDGHPSSPRYAEPGLRPGARGEADAFRPLTDAEHAEHVIEVEARLEEARAAGLETHVLHTIDVKNEIWSDERAAAHDAILDHFYAQAATVPCEHRAFVAGGLAGAGKTTVLANHAGIHSSQFLMINPDIFKEELGRRGLVPCIAGLSPMEASDLVHEESSMLAKRLARRAQSEGKNIIWDITMSSAESAEDRVASLRASGYDRVDGLFVDIPVDVSLRRTAARHREGHEDYRAGIGLGGRYVPPEMILAQVDDAWASKNRSNFEQAKHLFDYWAVYDNSEDGRDAVLSVTGTDHIGRRDE